MGLHKACTPYGWAPIEVLHEELNRVRPTYSIRAYPDDHRFILLSYGDNTGEPYCRTWIQNWARAEGARLEHATGKCPDGVICVVRYGDRHHNDVPGDPEW